MTEPAPSRFRLQPFTLRGALIVAALYGLVHSLVRLIAGTNLAMDDPKENIFTQQLQWGYLPDNPPLFEWILTLVQQVTGPNIFSFLIVKYALLVFSAAFFFMAVRRVIGDSPDRERWAAITTYSAILLYQIGWNYHQAFTHSLMTIAATCFALWALIRLLQERRWRDYLVFGAAIGLGLMAKYNFAGFLAAMAVPVLMDKRLRSAFLTVRILPAIAIAALILTPHLLWLNAHRELLEWYASMKLGLNGTYGERVGEGLGNALVAIISFYLPFLIVAGLVVPGALTRRRLYGDPVLSMLRRSLWVSVVLILAGVCLAGVSNVTERYVVPFFLPSFIWLMMRLRVALLEKDRIALWGRLVAAGAVAMILGRIVNVGWGGPPVCDECHRWVPYAELRTAVKQEIFDPEGVYIAYEENTAGNLRRLMPNAAVRSINLLFYNPVEARHGPSCYFVWSEELLGVPIEDKFKPVTQLPGTRIVNAQWRHPFKEDGYRETQWGISPVPPTNDFYRRFCTENATG